ncbi:alpha/beta fold hydrolase [Spirosoma endbachense]|uniref:Alpha/beta fold hydrolase n=1 Tax=Spirosoma endbachense TaxID=2666025 RepID=A0A6P1W491_9BACT|nr:alpha/beta hydrolase [Spirosoma endbachense]QHV99378.1 alpha/beta fold hydrolase [Spirosoma endbachense]
MNTQVDQIDGLQIRYASHQAGHAQNVLLLSPLPESLFAFTPMWNALAEQFNLLAIDLPGFGQSEGRADLYSPKTMAAFVSQLIDHFAFRLPHIIGPDIGTPVALFVAANFPQQITSLIISGGACVYPLQVAGFLKELLDAPDLSGYKQLAVADLINASLSELKNYSLPTNIRADYLASYAGENRITDAFQLLRAYATDLPELDKQLDSIEVPIQIIWGTQDPVAPIDNAHILYARLPKNNLTIIEHGQHYIWEENSADYLAIASRWLNGGYETYFL